MTRGSDLRRPRRMIRVALISTLALTMLHGMALISASPVLAADVGYVGPSFAGASAPSAEKPQSKLWFNDGIWWGGLFNSVTKKFEIYRYDWSANTWSGTGVVIDERYTVRIDCLWDGVHLYVASAVRPGVLTSDTSIRITRFSYGAGAYTRDTGFPVTLATYAIDAIVIDKDSTGVVWATYATDHDSNGFMSVFVAHSTTTDTVWTAPYELPFAEAKNLKSGADGDMSALVAYSGQIGVMWSNQGNVVDNGMYFASHLDGAPDDAWTPNPAVTGPKYGDDHMNLKTLQVDAEGRIFAVTKTEMTTPDAPLILLLVLDSHGNWQRQTIWRVADNPTRPLLLIDQEHRELYVFAASPCCSGGTVYLKQTSLDNPTFDLGLGTPFIDSATNPKINNISSTKQPLDGSTGLLAIAGDDSTKRYVYNRIAFGPTPDTTPPETAITYGPSGTVNSGTATFEFTAYETATFACRLDGGPVKACVSPLEYTGLADGPHTFEVWATDTAGNADPTPATASWTVNPTTQMLTFTADADSYVRQDQPTRNYGNASTLNIDSYSPRTDAYVKFNVAGASGNVTSAKLRLYVCCSASSNGPKAYATSADWTESGINWTNKPSAGSHSLGDLAEIATGTWVEYDVTGSVGGNGSYSFALIPDSSDGTGIASREYRDGAGTAYPPQLIIETSNGPDTIAPDTVIDSAPPATSDSDSATFSFSSSELATFECRLDGAVTWEPNCLSPTTYTGLADGPHTFEVRATDLTGNLDGSPANYAWTVNTSIETITVRAEADATVFEARPTTNYGSLNTLTADMDPKPLDSKPETKEAYLRFTVTGVTGTVQSATLRLYVTNSTVNIPAVFATGNAWDEGTLSWNNRPAPNYAAAPIVNLTESTAAGRWIELDVTSAVTADGTFSFVLVADSTDALSVSSDEGNNPPELVVVTPSS